MVSPSTLIRQARATKNPKKRLALRKEAAALRRRIRHKAKKVRKPRVEVNVKFLDNPTASQAIAEAQGPQSGQGVVFQGTLGSYSNELTQSAPKYIEPPLVSTETVERLRHMARNRKYPESFEIALRSLVVDGKVTGRKEAEQRHIDHVKQIAEVHAINTVCGFMAIVKDHESRNKGPLPPSVTLSGYTVAKIYDALRDAGYTENGKDSGFRRRA